MAFSRFLRNNIFCRRLLLRKVAAKQSEIGAFQADEAFRKESHERTSQFNALVTFRRKSKAKFCL